MRRTTIAAATLVIVIAATSAYRLTRTSPSTLPTATPPTSPQPAPTPLDRNEPSTTFAASPIPTTPATSRPIARETPTHAALRFLDLDEELFPPVTPEKARALTESIAATSTRNKLGDQAEEHQRQTLAKGDLAGLKLRIAPIATRTRNCTDKACIVDVYFLRLWSFPGRGALDDYATVEIHIINENNEWRLESSSFIDGPYPAGRFSARPNASFNAPSFEANLNGFTDNEINP